MHKHSLAVVVLATFLVSATSNFAFYKLNFVWPPSACNTGIECKSPIRGNFSVIGLWPVQANDVPVPPYNITTNKCTEVVPTSEDQILNQLMPIENNLKQIWPNLKNGEDSVFWKAAWKNHGMCSDFPTEPVGYFTAALCLAKEYNPLKVMGITPKDRPLYQVKTILEAVKKNLGAYPQIVCNMQPGVKTLQLWQVRYCFKKGKPPIVLQDCPNKLAGTCTNDTDLVRFTPPPPIRFEAP